MTRKSRIRPAYVLYPVVVALLSAQIVIAAGFVQKQKYDGIRINLLGRQRMLTQKLSREVILYSQNRINARTALKNSIPEFRIRSESCPRTAFIPA
ncbi:MAG TPA: hypothetical protein PK514_03120 [Spirochaetota bacterium]|nr:hypothetical protein [Spirochaetota bacterium]